MDFILNSMNLPVVMDILAFAASMVLIAVLVANRRRYGRLVLGPAPKTSFGSDIKLQMVTQQSQRSYSNIQRALRREFEDLQRMTGVETVTLNTEALDRQTPRPALVSPTPAKHYDQAARLIRNGADPQCIVAQCGLSRGEIDLMSYMQHKRS